MKKILKMLLLAALICVLPAGCTIENRREAQTEQEETIQLFLSEYRGNVPADALSQSRRKRWIS